MHRGSKQPPQWIEVQETAVEGNEQEEIANKQEVLILDNQI